MRPVTSLETSTFFRRAAFALCLIAAGCGGGGGGGGGGGASTTQSSASTTVSGSVTANRVAGATVRIYSVDRATLALTLLDSGVTDANGLYNITVNDTGPLFVHASGGSYVDESTGQTLTQASAPVLTSLTSARGPTLEGILDSAVSGSATLNLNPLTSLASRRLVEQLRGDITALGAANVLAVHQLLGGEFGLGNDIAAGIDPRGVDPVDFTDAANASFITNNRSDPGVRLGLILAGLSEQARALGLSDPLLLVDALGRDFADGHLNGAEPTTAGGSVEVLLAGAPLDARTGTTLLSAAAQSFLDARPQNASGTTSGLFAPTLLAFLAQNNIRDELLNVNRAPLFNPLSAQVLDEDAGAQTLTLSGITAGSQFEDFPPAPSIAQVVTITASSSDSALLPDPVITGAGASRTLTFIPAANASGQATVTVTAMDNGGTQNGGIARFERSFTVTINPINDAPTVDPLLDARLLIGQGQTLVVTGLGPGGGPDEANQPLSAQVSSSDPSFFSTLLLGPISGGQANLDLAATRAGQATVTVTVSDGQAMNATSSVSFTVAAGQPNGLSAAQLFRIGSATGQPALVSGYGFDGARQVEAAAFDAANNRLILFDEPTRQLFALDLASGALSPLGAPGELTIRGLAVDAAGALFGVAGGQLLQLDLATGRPTILGSLPGASNLRGLTFDPGSGLLFAIQPGAAGSLYAVDPTQPGAASQVTAALANIESLAVSGGVLYGADRSADTLLSIDTATGATTLIGALGFANVGALSASGQAGALLGVDTSTDQVISVDIATGAGSVAATLSFLEVSGLAVDNVNDIVYGVDVNRDRLLRIDPVAGTGAAVLGAPDLGAQGFGTVRGLAFDDLGQVLYATDTSTDSLLTINVTTGMATVIGATGGLATQGFGTVQGLAFDGTNLFATDTATDTLIRLDPATGTATVIGAMGGLASQGFDTVTGLTFEPLSGDLLGSHEVGLTATQLVRIDRMTGTATLVGALGVNDVEGLALRNGALLGASKDIEALLRIDLATGAATSIGRVGATDLTGFTYDPASDTLFAIDGTTGALLSLSADGGARLIGMGPTGVRGLAFDTATGTLYASQSGSLLSIDPATAMATTIGGFGLATADMRDIAVLSGVIYGVQGEELFAIDPASGMATSLATLQAGVSFLGLAPTEGSGALLVSSASQVFRYELTTLTLTPLTVSTGGVTLRGLAFGR